MLRGGDGGEAFVTKAALRVRDSPALLCRLRQSVLTPGESLTVELLSGDRRSREYVIELLSERTPLAVFTGNIQDGRFSQGLCR